MPLPPWKQAPWKTYLRQDVTLDLRAGENLLAVGVTLYGTPSENGMGSSDSNRTPMSACLFVEMADGTARVCQRQRLESRFQSATGLAGTRV